MSGKVCTIEEWKEKPRKKPQEKEKASIAHKIN